MRSGMPVRVRVPQQLYMYTSKTGTGIVCPICTGARTGIGTCRSVMQAAPAALCTVCGAPGHCKHTIAPLKASQWPRSHLNCWCNRWGRSHCTQ